VLGTESLVEGDGDTLAVDLVEEAVGVDIREVDCKLATAP
jgi:hypothetical protein